MFLLDLLIDCTQVGNEFFLLGVFPKYTGHFFLERGDDVSVNLEEETSVKLHFTTPFLFTISTSRVKLSTRLVKNALNS